MSVDTTTGRASRERDDFLSPEPCQSLLQPFEDRWHELAEEVGALEARDWLVHPDLHVAESGWLLLPVRYFGADHPGAETVAPVLASLVARDHRIRGAGYYSMAPGTELVPHRGNPIGLARFHLGLDIPEQDCGIQVGSSTRRWIEGAWLGFDDSIMHTAWNRSDRPRRVLILDLEHPDVPVPVDARFFQWASRTFYVTIRRFPRLQAVLGRVNWISRAAQRLSTALNLVRARKAQP